MREYGQIQCSYWTNPDNQSLSDKAKLLGAYLLSGPHSNGLGCYRLPPGYVMADFKWDSETVTETLSELSRNGFINHCLDTDYVLILKFLKWNPISNGNVAKARQTEFEAISKKVSFYNELCAAILKYGNHLPNPFETLLKGYAKQDPTQPNPTQPNPIGAERARETDQPSGETVDAEPETPVAAAAKKIGCLDFKPDDTTIELIGMKCKDITQKSVNDEIPDFLSYARNKYPPHTWQNQFHKWVVRSWQYKKANPKENTNGSNGRPASTPAGRGKQALERLERRGRKLDGVARETH